MQTSPKLKISLPSATGGADRGRALNSIVEFLRRLSHSLIIKLCALVGIFVALPIVLYGQFESADRQTRTLVTSALQNRSWLIAQALQPLVGTSDNFSSLNDQLAKFAQKGTALQLMFQPKDGNDGKFYFIASAPHASPEEIASRLDSLTRHNILPQLSRTCTWDSPVELRYVAAGSGEQVLTSVIPITTASGCWVLISSHDTAEYLDTAIGRPYWQTREVRMAALIYMGMAALAILLALGVRRSMRHFRETVRQTIDGRIEPDSFSQRNVIPELASVAADFDRLVFALHDSAQTIRESAENNAHSFKGPVATIQAALETLRRNLPEEAAKAHRATDMIGSALDRLRTLISAAQRLDNNAADLLEAPRIPVNLSLQLAELLLEYRATLSERGIVLALHIDEDVVISAAKNIVQVAIENIVENAIGFAPPRSTITVRLLKRQSSAELFVEDEGPGIETAMIERVFDRYVSLRAPQASSLVPAAAEPPHSGLGLWISRRNIEALGGRISASNRVTGGLTVLIILPLAEVVTY
jgi:two-component system, OmpR family, sensor histidine kinase ChvG